jgi:hypothetical protein
MGFGEEFSGDGIFSMSYPCTSEIGNGDTTNLIILILGKKKILKSWTHSSPLVTFAIMEKQKEHK